MILKIGLMEYVGHGFLMAGALCHYSVRRGRNVRDYVLRCIVVPVLVGEGTYMDAPFDIEDVFLRKLPEGEYPDIPERDKHPFLFNQLRMKHNRAKVYGYMINAALCYLEVHSLKYGQLGQLDPLITLCQALHRGRPPMPSWMQAIRR